MYMRVASLSLLIPSRVTYLLVILIAITRDGQLFKQKYEVT